MPHFSIHLPGLRSTKTYTSVGHGDEEEEESSEEFLRNDSLGEQGRSFAKLMLLLKVCFLLLCVALLAIVLLFLALGSPETHAMHSDILSPVPFIPLTTVLFDKNESYAGRPSPETDDAWNSLLPPGRGFVFIDDPRQYHLELGQSTPWGEIFSVSLFHQLHCLGEIRKYYWTLLDGILTNDSKVFENAKKKATMLAHNGGEHVNHCIDYIRQGIMCAGDMSMEWPRVEPDGRRVAVDGWEIPHECKNWEYISLYMEKNHFNWSTNSNIAPD